MTCVGHNEVQNAVMEMKSATSKQPSESTAIADPLSTKLSDKIITSATR